MYKKTREVSVGRVTIGGGRPAAIQSMLSPPSWDIKANVEQAVALEAAGCEIIRAAVPDRDAVALIPAIKEAVGIPLVADIHFDYRLALESAAAGVDKIRINPGNIGGEDRVRQVAAACAARRIPIRIGVNSGSMPGDILAKHGGITPEAIVEAACYHVALLNRYDFDNIVLSLKSSDVHTAVLAYRLAAERLDYPLHLGITEAGTERMAVIKAAAGLGSLLLDGIGDTLRVSITGDPVREVLAARDILKAVRPDETPGVNIISCPTCGRTRVDIIGLTNRVEELLAGCEKNITVAVMGCAVNGPGEARRADIGIAGGDGCGILFRHGEVLRKVPEEDILAELLKEIDKL